MTRLIINLVNNLSITNNMLGFLSKLLPKYLYYKKKIKRILIYSWLQKNSKHNLCLFKPRCSLLTFRKCQRERNTYKCDCILDLFVLVDCDRIESGEK